MPHSWHNFSFRSTASCVPRSGAKVNIDARRATVRRTIDYLPAACCLDPGPGTRRKRNQTNSIYGNLHADADADCTALQPVVPVATWEMTMAARCCHSNVTKAIETAKAGCTASCPLLLAQPAPATPLLPPYWLPAHACCTFGALSPHSHLPQRAQQHVQQQAGTTVTATATCCRQLTHSKWPRATCATWAAPTATATTATWLSWQVVFPPRKWKIAKNMPRSLVIHTHTHMQREGHTCCTHNWRLCHEQPATQQQQRQRQQTVADAFADTPRVAVVANVAHFWGVSPPAKCAHSLNLWTGNMVLLLLLWLLMLLLVVVASCCCCCRCSVALFVAAK